MIGRSIIQSSRVALQGGRLAINRYPIIQASRGVHKGIESVPPMRFMSVPERVGLYCFIAFVFLSYPTYLLLNLDNIRPKGENSLGEAALAERERRLGKL